MDLTPYSGIIINQNQTAISTVVPSGWLYQDFYLPTDYARGTDADELVYPDFTGFQVMFNVTNENIDFDWVVQYQSTGSGWITLASGKATSAPFVNQMVWVTATTDAVPVSSLVGSSRWRLGIDLNSGISGIWYSQPNPLSINHTFATGALAGNGLEYSILFRILGGIADSGVDFLGNNYRSAVITHDAGDVSTALGADPNSYFMSRPYPSKFAVENLYFDIRNQGGITQEDQPSVIDSILMDPITSGVYFNVYYSNDGDFPGDESDWENKLWTHVPQTYRAERRETHVLPEPVAAKWLKIEFSHLQAQYYAAGSVQNFIQYKKHPKWVLDYFLARLGTQAANENPFLTQNVTVVYDALNLAYSYYKDDIVQPNETVTQFLSDRTDQSDRVDPITLDKISLVMQPYLQHPALQANRDTLFGNYVAQHATSAGDYPVERTAPTSTASPDVSVLNRESVVFEQNFPVMFFYLTCRHTYREVQAEFKDDKAYFVGIRTISLLRNDYSSDVDTDSYIDVGADLINTEINEFSGLS